MSYVEIEIEVQGDDLEEEEDGGKRGEKERRGRWR